MNIFMIVISSFEVIMQKVATGKISFVQMMELKPQTPKILGFASSYVVLT